MSLFVTGTDTGVGKTHTVIQLLRLLRASGARCAGMKPICCGDRRDAELLLAAGSGGLTIDEINPVWLKTPVAPLAAAHIEHAKIVIEDMFGLSFDKPAVHMKDYLSILNPLLHERSAHYAGSTMPGFKGSWQHCLVGVSIGVGRGLRRVSSSRVSCGVGC